MVRVLGSAATALATVVLVTLCAAFAILRISGMGVFVVTGGSMEPAIHNGSLVIVEPVGPQTVNVGDVITFVSYDQVTTRRVTGIQRIDGNLSFRTKGDANVAADPEAKTFPGRVTVMRASVPLLGYAVASAQVYGRIAVGAIAAVVFVAEAFVVRDLR